MASSTKEIIPLEKGWKDIIQMLGLLTEMMKNDFDQNKGRAFDNKQYMEVYNSVYNMCTQRTPHNWSAPLYERHGDFTREYLTKEVLASLKATSNTHILEQLERRWGHHKIMVKWMSKFFMYLDRFYVQHHTVPKLKECGMNDFKSIVYQNIKANTTKEILSVIRNDRDGLNIDKNLIKKIVAVYERMGMESLDTYTADLEKALLEETRLYYSQKGLEWLSAYDTPSYLQKAEEAFQKESDRVKAYLIGATEKKIAKVCEDELLEKHEEALITKEGSGCKALLENKRNEHLSRMFRLFNKIPNGLEPIAKLVREHIEEKGKEIVDTRASQVKEAGKDNANDPTFVKALMKLHDHFNATVENQFCQNPLFQKAMKEAFEVFLNNNVGDHTNAEMLASYCDRFLKTGGERMTEEQVEQELEKVVQLFTYLQDKDLFAEIYRNLLAKRLLNKRSASDDAEKSMISMLKLRCGSQFTQKMEGMISDLAIGKEHLLKFKQFRETDESKNEIDFSVQVLTTGYWPTYVAMDLTMPNNMQQCLDGFAKYYDKDTNHRRLTWVYSLGGCNVRMKCGKSSYDLSVTTLQAALLNMFSDFDGTYSFDEITAGLNLTHKDPAQAKLIVKKILHSLSCGKHKVLRKDPKSKKIETTDKFSVNAKFKAKQKRLRIPMASLESSHNAKKVEEDRTHTIEAAIVRIMKARGELKHNDLMAEVIKQLSFFKPRLKVVKRCIEKLIEREFLERHSEKPGHYRYLA